MKGYNCPNCGSPYEKDQYKCPYCGTWYIDLTMIDFDNQTPFFLSIKKNNCIITQKVMPQTASFDHIIEETSYYGGLGNKYISHITSNSLETNIQFIAIPDENNTLCEIKKTN